MGWTKIEPSVDGGSSGNSKPGNNGNGGGNNGNGNITTPDRPVVKSYTLVDSDTDLILYAKWDARVDISVKVTFSKTAGSALSPNNKQLKFGDEYGELAVTTCAGLKFLGWYTELDGKGDLIMPYTIVTAKTAHTLYPKWKTISKVTITLDCMGGTSTTTTLTPYLDSGYGTLPTPRKDGYIFLGWYTEPIGGVQVTAYTTVDDEEPHTLYARYQIIAIEVEPDNPEPDDGTDPGTTEPESTEPESTEPEGNNTDQNGTPEVDNTDNNDKDNNTVTYKTVTVSFNSNGGAVPSPSSRVVQVNNKYTALAYTYKDGYSFIGWYLPNGVLVTENTIVTTETKHTLKAGWIPKVYKVTFETDGIGAWDKNNLTKQVSYKSSYGTLPEPVNAKVNSGKDSYYEFIGWYDQRTSGNEITGDTVMNATRDLTFYARWQEISTNDKVVSVNIANNTDTKTYTPRLDVNGGDILVKDTVDYKLNKIIGALPIPTRKDYKFIGWFTTIDGSGGKEIKSNTSITAQITVLYARWEKNAVTDINSGTGTIESSINTADKTAANTKTAEQTTQKAQNTNSGTKKSDDEVQYITVQPLFQGYGDDTIKPDQPITNAETAAIIFRLVSASDKNNPVVGQANIGTDKWYSQAANYLIKNKIMDLDNGSFYPNKYTTRAEFTTAIAKWARLNRTTENPFTDVDTKSPAAGYINSVRAKGWISGYGNNIFGPERTITRAEVSRIFLNILGVSPDETAVVNMSRKFNDIDEKHWAYNDLMYSANEIKVDLSRALANLNNSVDGDSLPLVEPGTPPVSKDTETKTVTSANSTGTKKVEDNETYVDLRSTTVKTISTGGLQLNLSQNALIVTVNDKTSSLYGSNYFWIGVSVQNSYTNSKILDLCFEIYKDDILLENLSSSFVGAYKNNRVAIAGNSDFFAHLYYAYSGSGEYKIVVKNRAGIVIDDLPFKLT